MNILSLVSYDNLSSPHFVTTADVASGATTLPLDSTEAITTGTKLIVGVLNASTAQLVSVSSVPDSTHVVVSPQVKYGLSEGTVVTATLFNQFKIYFGASADISTHTSLATVDMVVSRNTTIYVDTASHDASTFYSYTYFNSTNSNESNRIPVISSGLDTEITPQYIKENYLYGLDLTQDDGQPLPEGIFWEGLKSAFAWVETRLNIDLLPKTYIDEPSDFVASEYTNWVFLKLKHFPVQTITKVTGEYYGTSVEFPLEWCRLKPKTGILQLVPTNGTWAQFIIPIGSGGVLPILSKQISNIPNFWRVSYQTGFARNTIPYDIRDVICKRASFNPLLVLGDLVGGVGVSSRSIALDGLSESTQYTNSAMFNAYGARIAQYEKEIESSMKALKAFHTPISLISI